MAFLIPLTKRFLGNLSWRLRIYVSTLLAATARILSLFLLLLAATTVIFTSVLVRAALLLGFRPHNFRAITSAPASSRSNALGTYQIFVPVAAALSYRLQLHCLLLLVTPGQHRVHYLRLRAYCGWRRPQLGTSDTLEGTHEHSSCE